MFEAGPINRVETLDPSVTNFVEQYEGLAETLGKLEPEQIKIINDKIVELDTLSETAPNEGVKASIVDCMERLAALVVSQMPERQEVNDHGIQVEEIPVDQEIEYKRAA